MSSICDRCGRCCYDPNHEGFLGGDPITDSYLRMPNGECRWLLPPNAKGERLCLAHNHPLRPEKCKLYPEVDQLDEILKRIPTCVLAKALKED